MEKLNMSGKAKTKYSMIVGFGIVGLVLLMIISLPSIVLDTFLGINMCLYVMILIMS